MSLFIREHPLSIRNNNSLLRDSFFDDLENEFFNHPLMSFPSIYPYYYTHPVRTLENQISKALNSDVFKSIDFSPKINLSEDEKKYYIHADLPGMTKDQVKMELSDDRVLTISGERETIIDDSKDNEKSDSKSDDNANENKEAKESEQKEDKSKENKSKENKQEKQENVHNEENPKNSASKAQKNEKLISKNQSKKSKDDDDIPCLGFLAVFSFVSMIIFFISLFFLYKTFQEFKKQQELINENPLKYGFDNFIKLLTLDQIHNERYMISLKNSTTFQ